MTCKDVKNIVDEYGTVAELVKTICTDRACTLDAIQKSLKTKNIEITEAALIAVISQIHEMMTFSKKGTYDIGDVVTYRRYWIGLINMGETIGNTIVRVEYKDFYLYNANRFTDDAFREHIHSKLEFKELGRVAIDSAEGLKKALEHLNIEKDKWMNYIFVGYKGGIYYKKWHVRGEYSTTEYL
jgi:superfamily I DNA/RNA helicase